MTLPSWSAWSLKSHGGSGGDLASRRVALKRACAVLPRLAATGMRLWAMRFRLEGAWESDKRRMQARGASMAHALPPRPSPAQARSRQLALPILSTLVLG